MPKSDYDVFSGSRYLMEYRGIRGGEMGGNAPVKTPPRVRMPSRNPQTKKFDIDERVMKAAARRLGLDEDGWATNVKAIPVMLTTDQITGDGGVVYVERAFYTGRGRQCSSALGSDIANQLVDVRAYAKNKTLKVLDQAKDVECSPECPMWAKPGEKSDCSWRAIVSVQLLDSPVFPSRSIHRTRSFYSIMSMIGSLNTLATFTGGVLSGIPLMFRQHLIDVRATDGQTRRIPIMSFDFEGPITELRRVAVAELQSRENLTQARQGKFLPALPPPQKADQSLMPEELPGVAEVEDEDDDSAPAGVDDVTKISSDVALLAKRLGYTPARMRLLEQKHEGDLQAMLTDLQAESGGGDKPKPADNGGNWGPGEAGDDFLGPDDLNF